MTAMNAVQLVVFTGLPGIGKSSLAEAAALRYLRG